MTIDNSENLNDFYDFVRREGRLRTVDHARRWTDGVLRTFGTVLDGGTKRKLAKALPEELANSLTGVFWLLHFRDPNLTSQDFLQKVARRSGNSNAEFALYPTLAIFANLKHLIDNDLDSQVAETLAPEISDLWRKAEKSN